MSIKSDAIDLLARLGIDQEEFSQYQVLCLPENIENQKEPSPALIDSGEAVALSKLLREEKIVCANSYDLGLETKVSERRSSEHYFGCIWILEHVAVPIVAGVVSRLLGEAIQRKLKGGSEAQVKADIKIIDEKMSADIHFSGDAEAFLKIFKGLDDD